MRCKENSAERFLGKMLCFLTKWQGTLWEPAGAALCPFFLNVDVMPEFGLPSCEHEDENITCHGWWRITRESLGSWLHHPAGSPTLGPSTSDFLLSKQYIALWFKPQIEGHYVPWSWETCLHNLNGSIYWAACAYPVLSAVCLFWSFKTCSL